MGWTGSHPRSRKTLITLEPPCHSRTLTALLFAFIRPYLNFRVAPLWVKNFACVQKSLDPNLPLAMYANHVSWYDAFLLMRLQKALRPQSKIAFPMAARQWKQLKVASYVGAVPMSPQYRDTSQSVRSFEGARSKWGRNFTLIYFPQGRIESLSTTQLRFQPGLARVLERLAPIQHVPVSIQFEMLQTPKPQAFLNLGEVCNVSQSAEQMSCKVLKLLQQTQEELRALGEDFAERKTGEWQRWAW